MTGVNFNTLINANNAGKVGIGLFNQQPTYRLDVMDDINIWTSGVNQGYRIGGAVVLQNTKFENIFVNLNNFS
ncbi:MAG: hypothetical protein HY738_07860 [Bacteroidia bacterium]|nr:hypothetical protein [Bacteroidia bacterium]